MSEAARFRIVRCKISLSQTGSTNGKFIKRSRPAVPRIPRAGQNLRYPNQTLATSKDLALAYSPGVAAPCMEIHADPQNAYKYTAKGNLVAVIPMVLQCWVWATSAHWPVNL